MKFHIPKQTCIKRLFMFGTSLQNIAYSPVNTKSFIAISRIHHNEAYITIFRVKNYLTLHKELKHYATDSGLH